VHALLSFSVCRHRPGFMERIAGQAAHPAVGQLGVKQQQDIACGKPISPTLPAAEPDADTDTNDDDTALPALDVSSGLQDWFAHYTNSERELWEVVRPLHVQKEVMQVSALRLPGAAVARIMQLHPLFASTSPDGLELVRCSTTLLLQASARMLAHRSQGQRVGFDRVEDVCQEVQELQFLRPLDGVLDTSSRRKPAFALASRCTNDSKHEKSQGHAQEAQLTGNAIEKSCHREQSTPTRTKASKRRNKAAGISGSGRPVKAAKIETDAPGIRSFFRRAQAGG